MTAAIPLTQEQLSKDANDRQRRAANPTASVWVSASAGTGKTKVLTDRVMRLLLPGVEDQNPATPAYKILCLTFTKAAAAEMYERVTKTLSKWVVANNKDLTKSLEDLLGILPTEDQMNAARKLFAEVIDVPGGLKIMTIHAFCESLLGRFPLEAGLHPGFEGIDEHQAKQLQKQSMAALLGMAAENSEAGLGLKFAHLLRLQNQEQLENLLDEIVSEKAQFWRFIEEIGGLENIEKSVFDVFGLTPDLTREEILKNYFTVLSKDPELKNYIEALSVNSKRDLERKEKITPILTMGMSEKLAHFDIFKSAFLTSKDEIDKRGPTKDTVATWSGADVYYMQQADNIVAVVETLKSLELAQHTSDLLLVAYGILKGYEDLKAQQNLLDFDDMIIRAGMLLNKDIAGAAAWVRYKLDGGIDHVLIDEAQDTNPEQWDVAAALVDEFYDGVSARENGERSLFVVGDEKQSIFSFQRADPDIFQNRQEYFKTRVTQAGKIWDPVPLNTSFRSTQAILNVVDTVFAQMKTKHISYRTGQAGRVEVWPLYKGAQKPKVTPWQPPIEVIESHNPRTALAKDIAQQILTWLDDGEILPSYNRPIKPKDILILVRSRNPFFVQIIRELKRANIPVSGADRMVVKDQLAVEDLYALCSFAILPDDNLTLATVLKTPIIGLSEEDLFDLSHGRDKKILLWDRVKSRAPSTVVEYLQNLIDLGSRLRPHDMLSYILQRPCPGDEISGLRALQKRLGRDVLDPIDECLNQALQYERDHLPSLQHYLHFIKSQSVEIKRELDSGDNVVRIMTVHGAKGLQAPIVFMPDTMRSGQNRSRLSNLLWPSRSGMKAPIWAPRSDDFSKTFREIYENVQAADTREYDRLLYVALTRAEEWLIVAGYETARQKGVEESWYHQITNSFEKIDGVQVNPFKTEYDNKLLLPKPEKRIYEISRTADPDKVDQEKKEERSVAKHVLPEWALTPPPAEKYDPPRPLSPSRPSEEDLDQDVVNSPLLAEDIGRFRRGNLTHALLQYLPDLAPDLWESRARIYLEKQAPDLSEKFRTSVVDEVLKIMMDENLKSIFTSNGIAEAPITALEGNKIITGQIDRIAFVEDEIWIIDYKTNRPPPKRVEDVPNIYKNQLKAYRDVLTRIYPDKDIKTYLLWTDGSYLMQLP